MVSTTSGINRTHFHYDAYSIFSVKIRTLGVCLNRGATLEIYIFFLADAIFITRGMMWTLHDGIGFVFFSGLCVQMGFTLQGRQTNKLYKGICSYIFLSVLF